MRIGYLVPEFPSQTHVFFWREILELQRSGAEVDIVSTRRPPKLAPHDWAQAAVKRTTYLVPMSFGAGAGLMWQLLKAGPLAWGRCAANAASGVKESIKAAARLTALVPVGARLAALAEQRRWDHLHVHSCADAANIALLAHLISRLPYSVTLHGDLFGYGGNQSNKWRHAAFAIVICQALIDQVRGQLGNDIPDQILKAPMGVDVNVFRRDERYVPFDGAGEFRVFCCGRLHPGKGHEDLIEAIALVRRQGFDARLSIAGDEAPGSGHRRHLDREIERLGLQSKVQLVGSLAEQDVRSRLQSSHVFALASHIEGLGVATMEAMAMQLPVVVTRSGGVAELVGDEREGLLVEPRQPKQMAAALVRLASNPRMCVEFGEAGRRKIEASYHSCLSARAILSGIKMTRMTGVRGMPVAAGTSAR